MGDAHRAACSVAALLQYFIFANLFAVPFSFFLRESGPLHFLIFGFNRR